MLTTDKQARKDAPLARGALDYFPNALMAVAELSRIANEQHNPGEEMHWARGKSNDHADCILRHLVDRGELDTDGLRHSAKVAWRALALLEEELEAAGASPGRASVFPKDDVFAGVEEESKSANDNLQAPPPETYAEYVVSMMKELSLSNATFRPLAKVYDLPW